MSPDTKPMCHRVCRAALFAAAVFGWASPARADLITTNRNVTLTAANLDSYKLDVDGNGTTDFTFTAAYVPDPVLTVGFATVDFPFASNNGTVIDPRLAFDGFPTVSLLRPGDTVSAANPFALASFDQGNLLFLIQGEPVTGNFNGKTGYVGLRFDGAGGTHYGFAQVTVNAADAPNNPFDLTIGAVGYESVAGQPARIAAVPGPAGVVIGGLGIGLLALRRQRSRSPVTRRP